MPYRARFLPLEGDLQMEVKFSDKSGNLLDLTHKAVEIRITRGDGWDHQFFSSASGTVGKPSLGYASFFLPRSNWIFCRGGYVTLTLALTANGFTNVWLVATLPVPARGY